MQNAKSDGKADSPFPITDSCFFSVITITVRAYLILLQINQV